MFFSFEKKTLKTFFTSMIVSIALYCTIFELFGMEYYRDLKI